MMVEAFCRSILLINNLKHITIKIIGIVDGFSPQPCNILHLPGKLSLIIIAVPSFTVRILRICNPAIGEVLCISGSYCIYIF
ncbi:hypothetical protein D3C80_1624700 [compost metagenome]